MTGLLTMLTLRAALRWAAAAFVGMTAVQASASAANVHPRAPNGR